MSYNIEFNEVADSYERKSLNISVKVTSLELITCNPEHRIKQSFISTTEISGVPANECIIKLFVENQPSNHYGCTAVTIFSQILETVNSQENLKIYTHNLENSRSQLINYLCTQLQAQRDLFLKISTRHV